MYLGRPSGGDSPMAIGDRAMRDQSSPQPPQQRNPTPRTMPGFNLHMEQYQMKRGGDMKRDIIRKRRKRRKRQRRKLGIRLVRCKLNRGVGVGSGDHRLMVGIGVRRLKVKDRWLLPRLLSSSGNSNNSNDLNNNNPHPSNNTEVLLSNTNLLLNINLLLSSTSSNSSHHPDHLNSNNNNRTNNKSPEDTLNNSRIDYPTRAINHLPYLINNSPNSSSHNKDGQINLNRLPFRSRKRQFHLLISHGIDPLRLLHRLNNRRIMNLGHCK
jgi:hypothetical protein